MLQVPLRKTLGLAREASRLQTVKKQTSIDLVHNRLMSALPLPARARAFALGLTVVVAAACTSVTPTPTSSAAPGLPSPVPVTFTPSARASASISVTPSAQTTESASRSAAPTASSLGTARPFQSGATGTPSATIDPAVAQQIDAVVAQVPPIRQLQATKDVPYQLISRDDFRNYLIGAADEDTTPEWRAAEERFLKRVGLLPPEADLNALLLSLYGAEVAAYYQPQNGTFYIIDTGKPFGAADKVTAAHEYTHALQDMHFDLEGSRVKDPAAGDAALGQLAVIEGDATLTSQNWLVANMSEQEQLQLLNQALGALNQDTLATMPLILRRQLEFPYTEGFLFARDLYGLGGYNAINQALQTPPASTEQILHSDKYYNHKMPVAVTLADLTPALGSGWSNVYQQTMGELNMQVLAAGADKPPINIPGLPVQWPHSEAAAGWGGDRLNMYEGPNNAWLIDWHTAWDTQTDANEFATRIGQIQATFGGTTRVTTGTQEVQVVIASDASLFPALPSG